MRAFLWGGGGGGGVGSVGGQLRQVDTRSSRLQLALAQPFTEMISNMPDTDAQRNCPSN